MWDSWWLVGLFVLVCGLHLTFFSPTDSGRWYAITLAVVVLTYGAAAVAGNVALAVVAVGGLILLVTASRSSPSTKRPGRHRRRRSGQPARSDA